MGQRVVKIETNRDAYSIEDVMNDGLTVGELIRILRNYDEDMPVVLSFDNGYTYGAINDWDIEEEYVEEEYEEDEEDEDFEDEEDEE